MLTTSESDIALQNLKGRPRNVCATVFIQPGADHSSDGPQLRSLLETVQTRAPSRRPALHLLSSIARPLHRVPPGPPAHPPWHPARPPAHHPAADAPRDGQRDATPFLCVGELHVHGGPAAGHALERGRELQSQRQMDRSELVTTQQSATRCFSWPFGAWSVAKCIELLGMHS